MFTVINPLTTNDTFWRHRFLVACYQLAQSVLKIGSGGGGCTPLAHHAWRPLQLDVEEPWSMLGGAICLLSCANGCRKRTFHLVGTPFLVF